MRKGFALPLILAVVAIGIIAVGAIAYFQLTPKIPYNPELIKQIEEKYSHLSPELRHKILNNEELTTDEQKELLKIELGEEEVNKIENKSDDQKAQTNLGKVATEVEACLVSNQADGIPNEKTNTINGGCADYKYFEKFGGVIENEVRGDVTMYADLEDRLICIWAKGGSIGVNNWAHYSTKEAKLILEDGSSVITTKINTVSDFPSNPVSCKI